MSSLSDRQERHYPTVWDKPPFISNSLLRWGIILGAIIYLIAAIASMETNISFLDDDYVQAITPDTIVYDSEWQTMVKVTGGDLEYTDSNDVFDASSPPQAITSFCFTI